MIEALIIWESNNGYTCGCCGQTWEYSSIEEFDSQEDMEEFYENANKEFKPDISRLTEMYELKEGGFRRE